MDLGLLEHERREPERWTCYCNEGPPGSVNQVVLVADYDRVVKERNVVQQERIRAEEHERLRAEDAEREIERLREALQEIASNWPDTDMTRERVEDLLIQSASIAERALAEPEERKKHD